MEAPMHANRSQSKTIKTQLDKTQALDQSPNPSEPIESKRIVS